MSYSLLISYITSGHNVTLEFLKYCRKDLHFFGTYQRLLLFKNCHYDFWIDEQVGFPKKSIVFPKIKMFYYKSDVHWLGF